MHLQRKIDASDQSCFCSVEGCRQDGDRSFRLMDGPDEIVLDIVLCDTHAEKLATVLNND